MTTMTVIDWPRLLLGDEKATFLVEVIVRIAVVYLILTVAMRVMGKRMATQATRNELAALVSLAGGVGPSIQDGKNGLLAPMVVAIVVVGIHRALAAMAKDHGRFERLTQGATTALVENGVFDMRALRRVTLSRLRLMERLRAAGIKNLGEVQRAYLEIDGEFTVVRAVEPRPGLSLVPEWDLELRAVQEKAEGKTVCARCGHDATARRCERCGRTEREPAVL